MSNVNERDPNAAWDGPQDVGAPPLWRQLLRTVGFVVKLCGQVAYMVLKVLLVAWLAFFAVVFAVMGQGKGRK